MPARVPAAVLAVLALLAAAVPADAGLAPGGSVPTADLTGVTVSVLPDLTTTPQRAAGTVHPDATAIAPASPADWTPIAGPVPGVLVQGTIADDPQARFLLRLPDDWNGKLVVGGSSGTRSEFNGDLVISDFVLQKGYAYASQNKGMGNVALTTAADPGGCPLRPVHPDDGLPPGTPANPLLFFSLLEPSNSIAEWGRRINQAALIAKSLIEAHYGTTPSRTYAMGVSNGGYQVRKAIEDHPQTFDGGVDWEGVFWREEGPNFIGELPVGLTHFPDYRRSGHDPDSDAAGAIRAAGYPPDLVLRAPAGAVLTSLWTLNRFAFWEVTACLYVKEVDPRYNPGPGSFERFAAYDPAERGKALQRTIRRFENSGRVTKPLISVHGTLDTLIPLVSHARAYRDLVRERGDLEHYRLYEVQNGNHLEAFKAFLPDLELIQPHAQRAIELLDDWVEGRGEAPPSQCVPRGGAISPTPAEASCSSLLVP